MKQSAMALASLITGTDRAYAATAHPSDNTSACSKTVFVASSRLSGGYLYFLNVRRTNTLNRARVVSRIVQSIVTLFLTVFTNSRAISLSNSSPINFTALSFVPNAIVKRQLILSQTQFLAPRIRLTHLARQLDQLLNDLRSLNRPIAILP